MIVKGKAEMSARYYGAKAVSAVYYGAKVVWEAVSSCFGSGMWLGDRPWSGVDGWKGNVK